MKLLWRRLQLNRAASWHFSPHSFKVPRLHRDTPFASPLAIHVSRKLSSAKESGPSATSAAAEGGATSKVIKEAEEARDRPPGPAGQGRDIWLPHDIIPVGSPAFYLALIAVPLLVWYNETMEDRLDDKNAIMREERLQRRAVREASPISDAARN
mmetsp:Transcript_57725/g.137375  ORF Transcript_57725/g.137375 Transcript_57725/m.137375 type:complete len:155 (-) Transcript_57725:104-568(-)